MAEKLLNTREVCQYLDISEEYLRKLVGRGRIPAYRLGGTILRFKKNQIEQIKSKGVPKLATVEEISPAVAQSRSERWRDFWYFNDFYIISLTAIIILLITIFFY